MTSKSLSPADIVDCVKLPEMGAQLVDTREAARHMDMRLSALQMANVRLMDGPPEGVLALAQKFYDFIVSGDAPPNS